MTILGPGSGPPATSSLAAGVPSPSGIGFTQGVEATSGGPRSLASIGINRSIDRYWLYARSWNTLRWAKILGLTWNQSIDRSILASCKELEHPQVGQDPCPHSESSSG